MTPSPHSEAGNSASAGARAGLRVGLVSLGCPKNQVDSEVMLGLLAADGFTLTSDAASAEVLVVNTCAFIDPAKQESVNTILELARYKEAGRLKALVVTGCLAQRYADELARELPEVDALVGTGEFHRIAPVVRQALACRRVVAVSNPVFLYDETLPRVLATPRHTAYVKIGEGCNHRCAFCVIPAIRGAHRSRAVKSVVAEAEQLAAAGVREVVLVSQDTSHYGVDLHGRPSLPELLRAVARVDGLDWVRVHYLYPSELGDDLLEVFAAEPKVCRYLDVPLQHVAPGVLRRMRRPVRANGLELVSRLRRAVPGAVLRTSFIVGFPGETEADFRALLDFLAEARFDRVGIFAYSAEEGTPAAGWPDQVPDEVKAERVEQAMALQRDIARRLSAARVGQTLPVLVEGKASVPAADWPRLKAGLAGNGAYPAPEYRPLLWGRTEFDAPEIDGRVYLFDRGIEPAGAGSLVRARVVDALDYDLVAVTEN